MDITNLPQSETTDSAALKIERLLSIADGTDVRDPDVVVYDESGEPINDGSEDTTSDEPTSGDEEESSDETNQSIEAPISWTAKDKELFQQLPPELQTVVTRRESEREKAVQSRMQQLADERKNMDSFLQKANAEQANYANTLTQLLNLTIPELRQFESTNWLELSRTDPNAYVAKNAEYQELRNRVALMDQEVRRQQQNQQVQLQQQQQARLADQYEQLITAIPDFADANKAKQISSDINSTLTPYGFSPEELGSIADARIVKVLHRLAQLEKAETAKKTAQGKKATAPAPRLMPASASAPVNRQSNKGKVVQDRMNVLRKSGKTADAIRALESIL